MVKLTSRFVLEAWSLLVHNLVTMHDYAMHVAMLWYSHKFMFLYFTACTGNATRYCDDNGMWSEPNVLGCASRIFIQLYNQV